MSHPLDRLTAAEIDTNRRVLTEGGHADAETAYMLVDILEPDKASVLAGTATDRIVSNVLMNRRTGVVTKVLVDVAAETVRQSSTVDVHAEGQPPIVDEEFDRVEELLRAHDGWVAAMAIPLDLLRARVDFGPESLANVTFILGQPAPRYLTASDLGGGEPDFHRPGKFRKIQFAPIPPR